MTEQDQGQATPEETDETQVHSQDSEANQDNKEEKHLTWEEHQRELRRVGKKEKSEGRTTREKELLEKSGAESIDEMLSVYEAYKASEAELESEAEKNAKEVEKLQGKIEELEGKLTDAHTLADSRLVDSELKSALVGNGVDPGRVKKILNDPDIEKPSVEDGKVEGVEDYVTSAKKEWPELFGKRERVPESPDPSDGSNPEEDARAKAEFQRDYVRSF